MANRKINFAVAVSPGHVYNIFNYIDQTRIESSTILLVLFYLSKDNQTRSFYSQRIKISDWYDVVEIEVWDRSKGLLEMMKVIFKYKSLVRSIMNLKYDFDTVILGQYNSIYVKNLINKIRFNKIVCLDEGNAVLHHVRERKQLMLEPNNSLLHLILGLDNSEMEKIVYFTSYNFDVLQCDRIVRCLYSYSKNLIGEKQIENGLVYIVGSPYVEDNILEKRNYLRLLNSICEYVDYSSIVYFRHRRELQSNLIDYQQNIDCEIRNVNLPLEIFIQENPSIPQYVVGFYSAALLNIKSILPKHNGVEILSFELEYDDILRNDIVDNIKEVYQSYRDQGVEVISTDSYVSVDTMCKS